ncbi:SUN domain-containing protein 2 [Elysia marginata]|uniref:SUN domain-containing protein 2 n=1 Tax=Elysia marginata TaxID=1093978 RepID=A0AAV4GJB9_9GAST|nr:SUN domain-containing protein 2 [Elysia marginata]
MCLDPRNWTGLGVVVMSAALLGYEPSLSLFTVFLQTTSTIVREALAKYNADRLGKADYALESAGGSILCSSNTYYSKSGALYSLFGVPLWYHSSTPRMVIQPEVQPGTCWAMDTTQGYVTVQLAMPVIITAISLEHIPKALSPLGRLDSAPKEIAVMGQEASVDSPEVFLGKFTYDIDQDPIQVYDIKVEHQDVVRDSFHCHRYIG